MIFQIQNLFCPALLSFHIQVASVYALFYFTCKKCLLFSDSFFHLSVLQYHTFSDLLKVTCCNVFSLTEFFCFDFFPPGHFLHFRFFLFLLIHTLVKLFRVFCLEYIRLLYGMFVKGILDLGKKVPYGQGLWVSYLLQKKNLW